MEESDQRFVRGMAREHGNSTGPFQKNQHAEGLDSNTEGHLTRNENNKDKSAAQVASNGGWKLYLETADGGAFLCLLQCLIHPVDDDVIIDLLPTTNVFEHIQCVPESNQE